MTFVVTNTWTLPCGECVAVNLPDMDAVIDPAVFERLHPAEARHAEGIAPRRQASFIGGRLALHAALARLRGDDRDAQAALTRPPWPLLPNDRGAPEVPAPYVGSISHKRELAVGLAAYDEGWTIGVDIEQRRASKQDISKYVLTDDEQVQLAALSPVERGEQVMLRFSLKESIYKAIDPHVRRYVGFQEVGVTVLDDGRAIVHPRLAQNEQLGIDAWWRVEREFVLTCARAQIR